MKCSELSVFVQESSLRSYWLENTLYGMQQASVGRYRLRLHKEPFFVRTGQVVALLGSHLFSVTKWIKEQGGIPFFVHAHLPKLRSESGVAFDLENGVLQCTDYLKQCGAKRIFFLGLSPSSDSDAWKKQVFEACCAESQIYGRSIVCQGTLDACVCDFIAKNDWQAQDAVFCANDTVALCFLQYRDRLPKGYPLPLLLGMGNSFLGQNCVPSLTTLQFDYRQLGEQAVKAISFLQKEQTRRTVRLLLPCQLLVRESTGGILPFGMGMHSLQDDLPAHPYFEGPITRSILTYETLLQESDSIDRAILIHLAQQDTYAVTAEAVGLTERAVQYRINAIKRRCKIPDTALLRAQLAQILCVAPKK